MTEVQASASLLETYRQKTGSSWFSWRRKSRPTPSSELQSDDGPRRSAEVQHDQSVPTTVFYLAYGSNLSAETFLGRRGIKPISQANVVVPSLKLTFDLPGIPYTEPCFANSGRRDSSSLETVPNSNSAVNATEKTSLLRPNASPPKYRKDRWSKGLVGVVYELTPQDFAHVIETEGGGASYRDIIVDCHPLHPLDETVPDEPQTAPVQAHTLFAPSVQPPRPGDPPPKRGKGGRPQRPDTSYAQPSARYLKLIHDGALEHKLPREYREYLDGIRPYRSTTQKQRLGGFIFGTVWLPLIMFLFMIGRMFADKKGRSPPWLVQLGGQIFLAMWASYDHFFKKLFGEGERTLGDDDDSNVAADGSAVNVKDASGLV